MGNSFTIDGKILKAMDVFTMKDIHRDKSMQGVWVKVDHEEQTVLFASTDTHRMAIVRLDMESPMLQEMTTEESFNFVLPMQILRKIPSTFFSEKIRITYAPHLVSLLFITSSGVFTIELSLDHNLVFPPISRVIPDSFQVTTSRLALNAEYLASVYLVFQKLIPAKTKPWDKNSIRCSFWFNDQTDRECYSGPIAITCPHIPEAYFLLMPMTPFSTKETLPAWLDGLKAKTQ